MNPQSDRRENPRLKLSYPIEMSVREEGEVGSARSVTANLSARGAYFKTFGWQDFREGQRVSVKIRVPHRLQAGEEAIQLHMRAEGRLLRIDPTPEQEAFGEDGVAMGGIAVKFDAPLEFRYLWM